MVYDSSMNQFMETLAYADWFTHLLDAQAKARINARIRRAELGNFGDCESIGEGVSEMRIHYGPSYCVYFLQWQQEVFILLAGGHKSTQSKDIKTGLQVARKLRGTT
jgi:putative addiction module killer protein